MILLKMDMTNDIESCLHTLNEGGLILYPTDTIWGIGCDASNSSAVAKIYALKKREEKKSMIVLMADEKEMMHYISQAHPSIFEYIRTVHKPTTVIYDGAIGFAENLIPGDGTIAIRVVKDPFCSELIKRFRKPIVSTSANISGHPSPAIFNDIDETIKNGVDYIVQHRRDDTTPGVASSIVKWNADGSLHIIRS